MKPIDPDQEERRDQRRGTALVVVAALGIIASFSAAIIAIAMRLVP